MKPTFMFILLVLSIFLYEAQGIRLGKGTISISNHHEIITKSLSSNPDDTSTTVNELLSGINRKLMTKTISSSPTTTTNNKNDQSDPKSNVKFTQRLVRKEEHFPMSLSPENPKHGRTEVVSEQYPDVIDITRMDYSPAKRKPPIHN